MAAKALSREFAELISTIRQFLQSDDRVLAGGFNQYGVYLSDWLGTEKCSYL